MQKWYIVMAKPRQEHSSTSFLARAGIETYYPEVNECLAVKGKRRFRRSGLFPGYFFAHFDYEREYRIISYSRGVRKIVAFGHIPAEVDPGLLREIQESIRKRDVVQVPSFRPGEVVRINSGPFVGIRAVFESAMPRKERAVVLLHVLSCQSRVVVRSSDIENFPEAV
jgi:transcription elongation factor/antiterminator RfaH